jgi:hypothetical protein
VTLFNPTHPDSGISKAELVALVGLLKAARLEGPHLEIGTAKGGTLRELMLAYPSVRRPPFVSVDTFDYFPNQRAVVERNLASGGIDPSAVDFRVSTSWQALRRALRERERFAFIFIDADHNADHVMQDLRWTRLLETGGYVCLHDYQPGFPGVVWAVKRFLRCNGGYRMVNLIETLIIVRKEQAPIRPEVTMIDLALALSVRPLQRLQISVGKRFARRRNAEDGP